MNNNLKNLNKHKAPCPDGLSNWLLKGVRITPSMVSKWHFELLYMEQKLPSVWKLVDITPLQKVKQVSGPKKELCPIFLTSVKLLGTLYFKTTSNRHWGMWPTLTNLATYLLALFSMVHKWLEATQRYDSAGISFRLPQSFWSYRSWYLIVHGPILIVVPNRGTKDDCCKLIAHKLEIENLYDNLFVGVALKVFFSCKSAGKDLWGYQLCQPMYCSFCSLIHFERHDKFFVAFFYR